MLLLNGRPRPGHRFTNNSNQRGLSCHATANQSVNARRRMALQEIFRRRPQYHQGFPYQRDFTEGGYVVSRPSQATKRNASDTNALPTPRIRILSMEFVT